MSTQGPSALVAADCLPGAGPLICMLPLGLLMDPCEGQSHLAHLYVRESAREMFLGDALLPAR